MLINFKNYINRKDEHGRTPLMRAVLSCISLHVIDMIDKGADLNVQDKTGMTALMLSSFIGHSRIVNILIERGAGIDIIDNNGQTALIHAAANGHLPVCEIFLENLHGKTIPVEERNAALVAAIEVGYPDIIVFFINHGADINVRNENGRTALMINSFRKLSSDKVIFNYLVENGAEINAQDNQGITALMFASRAGNAEAMKLLLKHGADPNKKAVFGVTALLMIAEGMDISEEINYNEFINILLENGSTIDEHSENGNTLLLLALIIAHTNKYIKCVIENLIDKGADVNYYNKNGDTALMLAAKAGLIDIVRLLIDKGADVQNQNIVGFNAWSYATKYHFHEITKILEEKGVKKVRLFNQGIFDNIQDRELADNFPLFTSTTKTLFSLKRLISHYKLDVINIKSIDISDMATMVLQNNGIRNLGQLLMFFPNRANKILTKKTIHIIKERVQEIFDGKFIPSQRDDYR